MSNNTFRYISREREYIFKGFVLILSLAIVMIISSCITKPEATMNSYPSTVPNTLSTTTPSPKSTSAESKFQGWTPGHFGLAITPDGETAYISFAQSDTLLVIDLSTFTVKDSIDVSGAGSMLVSHATTLSLDGKRLFVSNFGAKNVMVIRTADNNLEQVLPLNPRHTIAMTLSSDGKKLFVPSNERGSLCVVNTSDLSNERIFVEGASFHSVVQSSINPNLIYAAGILATPPSTTGQPAFFSFNLSGNTIERSSILNLPTNAEVRSIALNSDESMAYFGYIDTTRGNRGEGGFVAFDLNNFRVKSSEQVENGVATFTFNKTNDKAYTLGFWSGGGAPYRLPINEWDVTENRLLRKIEIAPSSDQRAIVVDPSDPNYLYMTEGDDNSLIKVDIPKGKVVQTLRFNKAEFQPYAIIRNDNIGYVASRFSPMRIFRLDLGTGQLIGSINMPYDHLRGWGFYKGKLYVSDDGYMIYALNPEDGSVVETYRLPARIMPNTFTVFNERIATFDYEKGMFAKRLLVFDANNMTLLNSVELPRDSYGDRVVASPDGTKLYVVHGPMSMATSKTTILVFDAATLEILNIIEVVPKRTPSCGSTGFIDADFDETQRILYLAGHASVYKIDMDTNKLIGILDLVDAYEGPKYIRWSPSGISGVVLSPSKDKLFVVSLDAHSMFTYDLVKSSWSTEITDLKGYFNTDTAVSQDQHYLYTANGRTDSVTMVDLISGEVLREIKLQWPWLN